MADPRTLRILELDGGGERGYMSLKFLQRFVGQWGIDPREIWKNFDIICGTSIGGIMALALAFGKSLDELEPFFVNDGPWVFTIRTAGDVAIGSNDASEPSNRPNTAQKALILADNDQFYRSVSSSSNYGSARLKSALLGEFGNSTLQDLKTNILVPSYQNDTNSPVLFSNLNFPDFIGQNELISNVALATSAAPIYLPPPRI